MNMVAGGVTSRREGRDAGVHGGCLQGPSTAAMQRRLEDRGESHVPGCKCKSHACRLAAVQCSNSHWRAMALQTAPPMPHGSAPRGAAHSRCLCMLHLRACLDADADGAQEALQKLKDHWVRVRQHHQAVQQSAKLRYLPRLSGLLREPLALSDGGAAAPGQAGSGPAAGPSLGQPPVSEAAVAAVGPPAGEAKTAVAAAADADAAAGGEPSSTAEATAVGAAGLPLPLAGSSEPLASGSAFGASAAPAGAAGPASASAGMGQAYTLGGPVLAGAATSTAYQIPQQPAHSAVWAQQPMLGEQQLSPLALQGQHPATWLGGVNGTGAYGAPEAASGPYLGALPGDGMGGSAPLMPPLDSTSLLGGSQLFGIGSLLRQQHEDALPGSMMDVDSIGGQ